MIKSLPSTARMAALGIFAATCVALFIFLWESFGGALPLAPKNYELKVAFPQAAQLVTTADVRIAGITVGHVVSESLDRGATRTLATLAIDPQYAPLPKATHAILRQKTILGETYIELDPGSRRSGALYDGARLADGQVGNTVQLDQILQAFDAPTRRYLKGWIVNGANAIRGRSQDLNDVLGNLPEYASSGSALLSVLDIHGQALGRLIKNSGAVFQALNARNQELRDLIVNSDRFFTATQDQRVALAEIFHIFPTFLDESKATLARLQGFDQNARPLVDELKPVADELAPALRGLHSIAQPLHDVFRDVPPVVTAAKSGLPQGERLLNGLPPLLTSLHGFLPELNPIVSYANFGRNQLAQFLAAPGASAEPGAPLAPGAPKRYQLNQFGIVDPRSVSLSTTRPPWDRGNAYVQPNAVGRAYYLGEVETFDCNPAGGEKPDPDPNNMYPPCFVAPPSLWDGKVFPVINRGEAPLINPPQGTAGTRPIPSGLKAFGP